MDLSDYQSTDDLVAMLDQLRAERARLIERVAELEALLQSPVQNLEVEQAPRPRPRAPRAGKR